MWALLKKALTFCDFGLERSSDLLLKVGYNTTAVDLFLYRIKARG